MILFHLSGLLSEHNDIRSLFNYSDKRQVIRKSQHISSELCKCQCLTSVYEDLTIVDIWRLELRVSGI